MKWADRRPDRGPRASETSSLRKTPWTSKCNFSNPMAFFDFSDTYAAASVWNDRLSAEDRPSYAGIE